MRQSGEHEKLQESESPNRLFEILSCISWRAARWKVWGLPRYQTSINELLGKLQTRVPQQDDEEELGRNANWL